MQRHSNSKILSDSLGTEMEIEGKIKEPSQVCMDELSLFCIRRVITSDLEEFQPKFSFDNKFTVVSNFGDLN